LAQVGASHPLKSARVRQLQ